MRPSSFSTQIITGSLLMLSVVCQNVHAENWGHWRGSGGNGVAEKASPPIEFGSTKNVKWKVTVPGKGSGSPVIWDDRVFVTSAVPVQGNRSGVLQFDVFCFDRATGKLLWRETAIQARPHEATHSTNTYASASPCTDGKHVYACFNSRGLYCYTMDGELVWKRNDFGNMRMRNGFGEGSSPTLAGDLILLPWDHEGPSKLYALDKGTGKTVWVANRDEPSNWATPLVVDSPQGKQVIANGQNQARAYDLRTGKELWRVGGQTQRPAASPVAGNGLVFIGSGFRGSFLGAFRTDGRGDIEGSQYVAWTRHRDTPDIGSPLLSENRLYFYKGKSGLLTCVDATTGEPHYETARIPGLSSIYASPVAAGGRVYLTGRSGNIVVIKDSEKLEILAQNSMGETVDATPAPVDNELFIRGQRQLFCIAAN